MSVLRLASQFFAEMRLRADKEGHPPWHPLAKKTKTKAKKKRAKKTKTKTKAKKKRAKKDVEVTYLPKKGSRKKRLAAAHARKRKHKVGDMVLVHTWICDNDPCPDCEDMDGQSIEDGEEFEIQTYDGSGAPPVHPNCNCQVESTWVEHGGDEQ